MKIALQQRYDKATRHTNGYHHFQCGWDKARWMATVTCSICGWTGDFAPLDANGCWPHWTPSSPEHERWVSLVEKHAHVPMSLKAIRAAIAVFAVLALPIVIFFGLCDGIPPRRMIERFRAAATQLEGLP